MIEVMKQRSGWRVKMKLHSITLLRSHIAQNCEKDWLKRKTTKSSQPFVRGDYTYFYKNDGLQNHSILYRQKEGEQVEVFLDPNTFSEDGTTSLGSVSFSKDYSLLAYSISEGGSDWRKIFVIDTETKVSARN